MKVVFVDVDGVLNSEHWWYDNRSLNKAGIPVSGKFLKRLRKIVRKTKAKVVMSCGFNQSTLGSSSLKYKSHPFHKILAEYGLEVYDYTYTSRSEGSEGMCYEIQSWLDNHPNVMNIAIINTQENMMHLSKYHVQTYFKNYDVPSSKWWKEGLTWKKAFEAIRILRKPYVNIYKIDSSVSRKKF